MNKIIEIQGQRILASAIQAVRTGGADQSHGMSLKPRVIIDFVVGHHGNWIIIDYDTAEERDTGARKVTEQWMAALSQPLNGGHDDEDDEKNDSLLTASGTAGGGD